MKYAIFSDVHSNMEAFEVMLNVCRNEGAEKYVCLGDIVGYGPNPRECLHRLWELELVAMVRGNHDEYVALTDEVMSGFNPNARLAVLWTRGQLSSEERAWLGELPLRSVIPGTAITIVHATLDSPDAWGYVFDDHHAADNFSYQFSQLCFCGHSHVPVAFRKKPMSFGDDKTIEILPQWTERERDRHNFAEADSLSVEVEAGYKYLFNIGSVGQPRNHDPRASFCIYDDIDRTVTRFRIPYDFSATQAKIRAAGLPEKLATRLASGT
ncbi:MAG: metallophosphoesterase family protein [Victivallaceae bacterium]|nr:metallophosphoesterase family protein [Victivallaceae bacterium]